VLYRKMKSFPYKMQNTIPKYTSNLVFTVQEEESLEKYFIKSSQIQYGLTYHQAQTLAYEFAIHCNKNNIPKSLF
ncbi:hypothetical protein NQ314_001486, partial [Rhamnusium bicolor]